jgi:hypothetical protein
MTIESQIKKEMKAGIKLVLAGKLDSYEAFGVCPSMVAEHMDDLGFVKSDLETNGWDYDWWLNFTKDGKSYTAFGSGYYGGFEFAPTEE